MQKTTMITLVIAVLFIFGTGIIMYYGRPIMDIKESPEENAPTVVAEENTPEETENESEDENEESEESTEETTGSENTPTTTPTEPTTTPEPTQAAGTYTSTQIATHAVESNCWASVGGNVYDLTSWVSRHPGGSKAIISLCGIDATSKFEKVHGGSSAAKAALALLKIGTLVQ